MHNSHHAPTNVPLRDSSSCVEQATPGSGASLAVVGLLKPALTMLRSELHQSLSLQDEMAQRVIRHASALAPLCDSDGAGELHGLMIALQSEDRLRQRHEGLIQVLSTLLAALEESEAAGQTAQGQVPDAGPGVRRCWITELVEGQQLEELRESLQRAFGSEPTAAQN